MTRAIPHCVISPIPRKEFLKLLPTRLRLLPFRLPLIPLLPLLPLLLTVIRIPRLAIGSALWIILLGTFRLIDTDVLTDTIYNFPIYLIALFTCDFSRTPFL